MRRRRGTAVAEAAQGDASGRSRREFLAGSAAVGAVVATRKVDTVARAVVPASSEIVAWQVPRLPGVDEPGSPIWDKTIRAGVALEAQKTTTPMKTTPAVKTVDVAALHDRKSLAVRLEWSDPQRSERTIRVDGFRDAVAILLGPQTSDAAVRLMGTVDVPVTLLQWKADWQRDIEKGFQGLEVEFPNATFDYYPPLTPGTSDISVPDDYEAHNATQWMPGYRAGNPISQMEKQSAVEKLVARGFGSATTQPTQNARGHGVWKDGRWQVVIERPLQGVDDEEITLEPGQEYSMAVAVWSGAQGDAGSRKAPSKSLLTLLIPDW
jgi:DMSO reductase family type II enzyme heme b subunit